MSMTSEQEARPSYEEADPRSFYLMEVDAMRSALKAAEAFDTMKDAWVVSAEIEIHSEVGPVGTFWWDTQNESWRFDPDRLRPAQKGSADV